MPIRRYHSYENSITGPTCVLHSMIDMSDIGNISSNTVDRVGITTPPFGARSLALSLLLGTRPPRLRVSSLVAAGELFGVAGGTMRTALSRMAAAGEVMVEDGEYRLAGSMVDRQMRQDSGRTIAPEGWDGTWVTITPRHGSRPLDQRRELRRQLTDRCFGELRPDYWLRPANVNVESIDDLGAEFDLLVFRGCLSGRDVEVDLVQQLWSVHELNNRAAELRRDLNQLLAHHTVDALNHEWLVTAFVSAAEVVRFLAREPRLPAALLPKSWVVDELRQEYDDFERNFQKALARFFREQAA